MDDYFIEEFRPPDDEMIDFVLTISSAMTKMSEDADDQPFVQQTLLSASRSLKILLAMAVAGHHLYRKESEESDRLAQLAESLYDRLLMTDHNQAREEDAQVLVNFRQWRNELLDLDPETLLDDGDQ